MDWLKDIQRTYKKFICSLAKYVIMINRTLWHIKLLIMAQEAFSLKIKKVAKWLQPLEGNS